MDTPLLELPALSALDSLEVIGSALVLLESCSDETSSTNNLTGELLELAGRFVEACDRLELIPVVVPSELPHSPV